MKRKLISTLLALCMMLTLLQGTAWAATSPEKILNSAALTPLETNSPELDNMIDDIFAKIFTDGMSTYQKVKACYDYLISYTEYGHNSIIAYFFSPYKNMYDYFITLQALELLKNGIGACGDYSAAFLVMTRRIGLESYIFSGQTSKAGGGYTEHEWNVITINGTDYVFDVQVEDNIAKGGTIQYYRFCKTFDQVAQNYIDYDAAVCKASFGGFDYIEYIYGATDSGEGIWLDADRLNSVTDSTAAASAVRDMASGMTWTQKASATGIDLATLYAETAVAKAASKAFDSNDILINAAAVVSLETEAIQAANAVETALTNGGVTTARYLSTSVTLTTDSSSEITIRLDPDILTTRVDTVRVEGPSYVISFKIADWADALTEILAFKVAPTGAETLAMVSSVDIEMPGGSTSNPITVSLPVDSSQDTTYQAVVSSTGTATASKYNPATTNIDGKVNSSGTYSVEIQEVDFTDITSKSAEMQEAIKYLAARGIIGGTGGTNFSPDSSISRAELTALVVRALGKVDSRATTNFTDVTSTNWFYSIAASSQKLGYINGFEDNTFRGNITINKEQIVVIAARVLGAEMNYKTPSNTVFYLDKYSDTVASWAQPQVALATKENLVVYRTDGTFSGAKNMTRGDAAIIIYRLFQRLW